MAIFGTYLRVGRGSEPVWFRGPRTSPKVPVIYGATSGGPNPKLMMTLKKACPPPLKYYRIIYNIILLLNLIELHEYGVLTLNN